MAKLETHYDIEDYRIPKFFYGSAWKEEKTAELVYAALEAGFRALDTANQRKHYFEEAVGHGIKKFLSTQTCGREDLFLQTKFTFARGQDHRKPYNESSPVEVQVADSFASSLEHLSTHYVDSYVLHGPYNNHGIVDEDLSSWAAMEKIFTEGKAKLLGVSNVSAQQLIDLSENVKVKPSFVQNRCYARLGWDQDVREVCQSLGIVYQGFSLLTANTLEISSSVVQGMARRHNKTVAQIVFRFCQQLGMIVLTGTSNPQHMREDLNIYDFELSRDEMAAIESAGRP